MPEWLDKLMDKLYDKVLIPAFGGTYTSAPPQQQQYGRDQGDGGQSEAVAMDTFRRRASSGYGGNQRKAPGFDYVHWKPYGKRRLRYYPNEYVLRCQSLAPYVKATAYAGYIGLEERRWAGEGLEPVPLGARGPLSSVPASLQGSRDILAKMGPGPQVNI